MAQNIQKVARLLGAEVVGDVPDVGGGAFGAARIAQILKARLQPGRGHRPGRPTVTAWDRRPQVPMSAETERKLIQLAQAMSTPDRKVSPMQLAAHLLEEAVQRLAKS